MVLLALVLAAVVVAGCGAYDVLNGLSHDLSDEGFGNVAVTVEPGTETTALVVVADSPSGENAESGQDLAAEVVWTEFPRHFERLRVVIDGQRREYGRDDLERSLGARPDGLDDQGDLTDEWNRVAMTTLFGVLAAGVVGLLAVSVLVIFLVRRNRRQRAIRPAWPPPVPHPHSGAGPQPWAPHPGQDGPPMPGHAPATHPSPVVLAKPGDEPPTAPAADHTPQVPVGAGAPERPRPRPWPADEPGDPRRLGRRPRGLRPPDAQLPPGWG